ncbi:MAG: hypothetical protein K2I75_05940 [Clostridiales bacterium]|nr:hypothetical protein [Clostridiales bacterium]
MTKKQIEETYAFIKKMHEQYLAREGVKLPKLNDKNGYTRAALVLVYLAQGYPNTKTVTKDELTKFIDKRCGTNDVQQARHLAAQSGWYVESGKRGDADSGLKDGEYKLKTLEKAYPGFKAQKRKSSLTDDDWEAIKKDYGNRCACCGSKEGENHLLWKNTVTVLQKGHMDPSKPLERGNVIPQCSKCNQPDLNYWVYNSKGRVIKIANPAVVTKSSDSVQREIYEILKKKFDKS